jgi:hypothetical protein
VSLQRAAPPERCAPTRWVRPSQRRNLQIQTQRVFHRLQKRLAFAQTSSGRNAQETTAVLNIWFWLAFMITGCQRPPDVFQRQNSQRCAARPVEPKRCANHDRLRRSWHDAGANQCVLHHPLCLFSHFLMESTIYQDRLGTDVQEKLKKQ